MGITFYTVDVGHGLCQIIRFSDRRAILIDGGGKVGKQVAQEFLQRYVDVIVAYIATHNDSDHVEVAPELLDNYPDAHKLEHIWLLFDRPAKTPSALPQDVIRLVGYSERRQKLGTIRGRHALYVDDPGEDRYRVKVIHREPNENAELQLLYPRVMDVANSFSRGKPDAKATNESSAILRLVVGGQCSMASVLVTGDANCRGFELAHEVYRFDLRARTISVPHHGGDIPQPNGSATWDTIVGWVSPEIAVISAGYGTVPSSTTTQRNTFKPFSARGVKICCTQITKQCHPNFEILRPGVSATHKYPQMSGRKEYPKAIGCYGTIAVRLDGSGNAKLVGYDAHQGELKKKVLSQSPLCR